MMKRTIAMLILLAAAAGCEPPPQATPPREKRSEVKIEAPGVKIDIQKKDR